jgi:PAS domain-containing protein
LRTAQAAETHEETAVAEPAARAALNNMVQGLAMFDAEHRLILCNRRYAEIYELSPEQVKLGTTLQEIIEHRLGNGLQSEKSSQEIVDSMLCRCDDGDFGQFLNQLGDGRCVAVTVQRMASGGTVTTHHDITEHRRSEAKIAHMAVHDTLTGSATACSSMSSWNKP